MTLTNRFITFEGGEGAGKSTQIALLKEYLENNGETVLLTREPGGTQGAEALRGLMLSPDYSWSSLSEVLIVMAARNDHWEKKILPALKRGEWVLCDRFIDSTFCYQGCVGGESLETIALIFQKTIPNAYPSRTYLLDLPIQESLNRLDTRGGDKSRFDAGSHTFHEKIREGFLNLAKKYPQRIKTIDAKASQEAIAKEIKKDIQDKFKLA